ncbi:MAG: VOC family protein [Acidimicrobiia bacterium]|nr:VOC family protein [Acidimicrobiia bacterium]
MDVRQVHHIAYRCRDAAQTADFYEKLLDLPLAHVIVQDRVPSTQQLDPHCHLFFELADQSYLAFFDVASEEEIVQAANPDWAQHIAMELSSVEELHGALDRLQAAGIDVLGPVDHGFIRSIYFYDPSGHRLELTCRTHDEGDLNRFRAEARSALDGWTATKAG